MKSSVIFCLFIGIILFSGSFARAQNTEKIHWINFNQLNDSLKVKPKKVFVTFYANWCSFCKQMDRETFTDKKIIEILNKDYYAIKMNIESTDTIYFGQQVFTNERSKRINPIHEIALLLASRKDHVFSLPAMILFDEQFVARARYFQFIDPKNFTKIISE